MVPTPRLQGRWQFQYICVFIGRYRGGGRLGPGGRAAADGPVGRAVHAAGRAPGQRRGRVQQGARQSLQSSIGRTAALAATFGPRLGSICGVATPALRESPRRDVTPDHVIFKPQGHDSCALSSVLTLHVASLRCCCKSLLCHLFWLTFAQLTTSRLDQRCRRLTALCSAGRRCRVAWSCGCCSRPRASPRGTGAGATASAAPASASSPPPGSGRSPR